MTVEVANEGDEGGGRGWDVGLAMAMTYIYFISVLIL
jgi:hypothetical protein